MENSTFSSSQNLLTFNYGKLNIDASSIKYIESIYGNYTIFKFVNRKQLVSSYIRTTTPKFWLTGILFLTFRKGVLINVSFMRKIDKRADDIYARMQDGFEFRVPRRKGKALL